MAARPDLVIAAVPYQEKSVSEILKAAVRFLGLAPRTLADIYTDIATIAGVVEANAIAKQLIANMKAQIELVRARTSGQSGRPRVFCEEWGKPIISSQAWVAEMVEAAGGEFLGEPGVRRTPEAVLAENPDVVITAWCGAGDRVPLQKIVRERGWEEMSAVRHSRVYCISDELLNTPAPTLLRGLEALTAAIHPELVSTIPALGQVKGLRQISETKNNPREHLRR
jgi:iron complex transport system substrate-binding protein